MAVYTRNEIKTAFVLLLDERPFTKITVKDVVLKCGVNRNTFYYYFRDLPDLAEAVVEEDYGQVTEGSLDIHTLGECLDTCIRFALEHRNAVMHLYRSTNRERFILSTRRVCDRITEQYLNTILDGHHITQEDRKYLHTYYRSILLGWMLDWLEDDMKSDIRKLSGRISQLKQGHMEDIIRRCEIK